MILPALLGLMLAALALWVLWLLADGVRTIVQRRRIEARQRFARTPLRLVVKARTDHTPELFGLTFTHPNGKRLPAFLPGQFLTVRIPGDVSRRYSLAAWQPRPREYRLGIRCVEGGRVSAWLYEHAQPGTDIEVLPPAGEFVLKEGAGDVVLVAGGIGLTPMAAMVDALKRRGGKHEVWLFHAAREVEELVDFDEYSELDRSLPWFHYRPWLSRPPADWTGGTGRLNPEILMREPNSPLSAAYYLCARQEMMDELSTGLEALGVPPEAVHLESFGGAGANQDTAEYRVSIAGHGCRTFQGQPSLLHALESWGVPVEADCRSGTCGACRIQLRQGEVRFCQPQGMDLPARHTLACCAVPASDMEIAL